jgi:hypothetical protein
MREKTSACCYVKGTRKGTGRDRGGKEEVEREYICTYNEITKHERNYNIFIYKLCLRKVYKRLVNQSKNQV